MTKKCFDCKTILDDSEEYEVCPRCGSYRVSDQRAVLWRSKNERWTIERIESGHIIVADNHTAWNDNPMLYQGVLYWDHPERVPKYVKKATAQFMTDVAESKRG